MPIDIHTHCDTTEEANVRQFVRACEDQQTRACIFSAGPRSDHDYCDNDAVLSVARKYEDVLIPFAFMDLWDKVESNQAAAFRAAGFRGLKCSSPYYPYDHDLYMSVYEQAETLEMPIVFHTGNYRPNDNDKVHRRPVLRNMHPLTIDRIARSFPDLKIIIAHLGTRLFRHQAAEMIKLHRNVYADLAGCGSWKALSAGELAELLRPHLAEVDSEFKHFDKLVLGSDAYVSIPHLVSESQRWYKYLLDKTGLPSALQEKIMGQTVASWLP